MHRRDQAPLAVEGRPRPWAPARTGGQGVRRRRRRVPFGADRRAVLRWVGRRSGRGTRRPRACPSCARTSRCREADVADARLMGADAVLLIVGGARRRRARRCRGPGQRARARRARRGARRARARPGAGRGRRVVGVNQRDLRDVRGGPRAGLRAGGADPRPTSIAVAESGIRDGDDARRARRGRLRRRPRRRDPRAGRRIRAGQLRDARRASGRAPR